MGMYTKFCDQKHLLHVWTGSLVWENSKSFGEGIGARSLKGKCTADRAQYFVALRWRKIGFASWVGLCSHYYSGLHNSAIHYSRARAVKSRAVMMPEGSYTYPDLSWGLLGVHRFVKSEGTTHGSSEQSSDGVNTVLSLNLYRTSSCRRHIGLLPSLHHWFLLNRTKRCCKRWPKM